MPQSINKQLFCLFKFCCFPKSFTGKNVERNDKSVLRYERKFESLCCSVKRAFIDGTLLSFATSHTENMFNVPSC